MTSINNSNSSSSQLSSIQQSSNINKVIYILDGIAILLIVLHHQLLDSFKMFPQDSFYIFINDYLPILGLALFTFSSANKFIINHNGELKNKEFINKYFIKRFFRLIKPYISYTSFIILLVVAAILINDVIKIFTIKSTLWDILNINTIIQFALGNPGIFYAYQLWFLYALIIINAVCFCILYYFDVKKLYLLLFPIIIFIVFFFDSLYDNLILYRVLIYLTIFIFGIYISRIQILNVKKYKKMIYSLSSLFIILFIVSAIFPDLIIFKYNPLLYGFTFPCFVLLMIEGILKFNQISQILIKCGIYSFPIYLFHLPFIILFYDSIIISKLRIYNIVIPIFITILTVITSIIIYKLLKYYKFNILME